MKPPDFFQTLPIRTKLLLAFGSIVLFSAIMIALMVQTYFRIDAYEKLSHHVDAAHISILENDANVKYFMFEGFKHEDFHKNQSSSWLRNYQTTLKTVKSTLHEIKDLSSRLGEHDGTSALHKKVDELDKHFQSLIVLLKNRGFKDFGLEGQLRKAIHAVENTSFPYNKAHMLMLRRHEKDFFLRKDLRYQKEFNQKAQEFADEIRALPDSDDKDLILANVAKYQRYFNEVVGIESEIGLTENDGLRGSITQRLSDIRSGMDEMRSLVKEQANVYIKQKTAMLMALFLFQIGAGILLAMVYAHFISRAIKEIFHAIKNFSDGIFPEKLIIRTADEIGKTKIAFNQLLDRIKAARDFAESVGKGKLNVTYNGSFKDDVLARSLITMQQQLSALQEKQSIINWTNEGIARLSDILKSSSNDIGVLGDRILKLLTEYVGLNQGALYVLYQDDDDEPYLKRISTYAYRKKKFVDEKIDLGKGLVGQCVLEKSKIELKEVPKDYVKITSGLGEAAPRYVVILPLKNHHTLSGVLEMAGFETLQPYKVEFLEKIAENIALLFQVSGASQLDVYHDQKPEELLVL